MTQALDCPCVRLGHHPEQARAVREQGVGDGEIGRERERCVLLLGCVLQPEGEN